MSEKKIPQRNEIEQKDQWDLEPLFATIEQWEETYNSIERKIEKYNSFKGKLKESFETFKEAIDFDLSISRDLEKIYTYAHLKNDEDKTNQAQLALYLKAACEQAELLMGDKSHKAYALITQHVTEKWYFHDLDQVKDYFGKLCQADENNEETLYHIRDIIINSRKFLPEITKYLEEQAKQAQLYTE